MPASPAASLPQHDYRASMPPRPIAVATPVPAEPEPDVQCGWCKVIGPLSQIPGSHGWYRCAKVWECIPRQLASGLPSALAPAAEALEPLPAAGPEPGSSTSLTSGNVIRDSRNSRSEGGPEIQPDAVVDQEPVPVLPPAQEEALAAFESAHAEQDAAEGKERSEDEGASETAAGPPAVTAEAAEDAGRSWLDKLADASLRAAEAKFGPMPHAPAPAAAEDVAEDVPEGGVQP